MKRMIFDRMWPYLGLFLGHGDRKTGKAAKRDRLTCSMCLGFGFKPSPAVGMEYSLIYVV